MRSGIPLKAEAACEPDSVFFHNNLANTQISIDERVTIKLRKLPMVITKEQIRKIICASKNTKHRLILMTTKAEGLWESEVIVIKLEDKVFSNITS